MSLLIRASNLLSMENMKVSLYFYRDPGNTIATQFPNREISAVHKCLNSQT